MAIEFGKEIFARNILVIILTSSMRGLTYNLWSPFFNLYLLEMGASIEVIGLLSVIDAASLLLQLPGGVLADKLGRKWAIVIFSICPAIAPIIYLFAGSWQMMVPGIILSSAYALSHPAIRTLMAESVKASRRGAALGGYRTLTSIPRLFTSFIGGVVLDVFGMTRGFRVFFFLSIFAGFAVVLVRVKLLRETLRVEEVRKEGNVKEDLLKLIDIRGSVFLMLFVICGSSFAVRIAQPFVAIYAVNVVGLSKSQWGLIGTLSQMVVMLLSIPTGHISDKFGRLPCIIVSRTLGAFTTLGLAFSNNFMSILLVRMLGGIGFGFGGRVYFEPGGPPQSMGTAWDALIADMIPAKRRAATLGLMGTIAGVTSSPASYFGGYLWDNLAPETTFYASFITGILFLLFLKRIKEERKY